MFTVPSGCTCTTIMRVVHVTCIVFVKRLCCVLCVHAPELKLHFVSLFSYKDVKWGLPRLIMNHIPSPVCEHWTIWSFVCVALSSVFRLVLLSPVLLLSHPVVAKWHHLMAHLSQLLDFREENMKECVNGGDVISSVLMFLWSQYRNIIVIFHSFPMSFLQLVNVVC